MKTDYYTLLNIPTTATSEEIKKAYRKLAVKWHPDKNKDNPSAEDKFKEISTAYDTLSNPEKRRNYDQYGHDSVNHPSGGQAHHDPFDVFNSFFTRDGNARKRKTQQGQNLRVHVEVKLSDLLSTTTKLVEFKRLGICNPCNGQGTTNSDDLETCKNCRGQGVVFQNMGPMQIQQHCPVCLGEGTILKHPCGVCMGQGTNTETMKTNIKIPKGCHSGITLRVPAHGNYIKGGKYGDLYVDVNVRPDSRFDRQGNDLVTKLSVDFCDMILGNHSKLDSLRGPINIKIPSSCQPDTILKVRSQGLPDMRDNSIMGDLYVMVKPVFPKQLNVEQKSILELYKKTK
jgi:molecular chaperone DnaJ